VINCADEGVEGGPRDGREGGKEEKKKGGGGKGKEKEEEGGRKGGKGKEKEKEKAEGGKKEGGSKGKEPSEEGEEKLEEVGMPKEQVMIGVGTGGGEGKEGRGGTRGEEGGVRMLYACDGSKEVSFSDFRVSELISVGKGLVRIFLLGFWKNLFFEDKFPSRVFFLFEIFLITFCRPTKLKKEIPRVF
jgi:hypothetical protein